MTPSLQEKWSWTSIEPYKSEWNKLLALARNKFNYSMRPYVCTFAGACFPKKFLAKYSLLDIPELCNDEARIPLFAQILEFKLHDTGLYKRNEENEDIFFNIEIQDIETKTIKNEIFKLSGRRVFHPYKKVYCNMVDWNGCFNLIHHVKKIKNLVLCNRK